MAHHGDDLGTAGDDITTKHGADLEGSATMSEFKSTDAPRVTLTEEDNKRIRRKTDKVILSILVWVYFLQILDKTILGYAAIFGIREAVGLEGNQYSLVSSVAPIAQLAWQPFSSWLIVRVKPRTLMPVLVLGWGIAQTFVPLCRTFSSLMAVRFLLGLFEAGCLPLFSVITTQWYRRSEQPVRVAAWYGTNGLATIFAAAVSYGFAHIKSAALESWQIMFLFTGLMTVLTVPFIYWKLDNDISSARFLTATERAQGQERLRANQNSNTSHEFVWAQVWETALDIKTWLFICIAFGNNLGAQVSNTFGPLILNGLGFDKYTTSLLNIPFGALQYIIILLVAWIVMKTRWKSPVLTIILVPVLIGCAILYSLARGVSANTGPLLLGYYFLAFIYGANTLNMAWIMANTGGSTKKSVVMSAYNAASGAGNIVGPLLFDAADAPSYHSGLRATMGVYAALICIVIMQVGVLYYLNQSHRKHRVANGKPSKIYDHSMDQKYVSIDADNDGSIGNNAFADLTDKKNDEFIYVY